MHFVSFLSVYNPAECVERVLCKKDPSRNQTAEEGASTCTSIPACRLHDSIVTIVSPRDIHVVSTTSLQLLHQRGSGASKKKGGLSRKLHIRSACNYS